MQSTELFKEALKVTPGGVHSPVRGFQSVGGSPLFFESAHGPEITSVEGDTYIDFCQSFGPLILGHQDQDVKAALQKMLDTLWTSGTCEPYSLRLAQWIQTHSPAIEKLRFVSSGTEAVMSALRVARGATGKTKVLKFEGCYHGHVDSLLVKSGSGLAGISAADSAGIDETLAHQTIVCSLDDEKEFIKVFESHRDDLAAVILEPLPANFGLLIQRSQFIRSVVNFAQSHGVLVIFDEVISGFRVGFGGVAEILGIKPDLVTYGKVLGGGLPVGCYGGRADLMDQVAPAGPVYQAGTLSASPLGMVAGYTQLEKIKSLKLHKILKERTQDFASKINDFLKTSSLKLRMVYSSSLFWLTQMNDEQLEKFDSYKSSPDEPLGYSPLRKVSDIPKTHKSFFALLFKHLLEHKIFMAPNGFEVGFIGYAHTPEVLNSAAKSMMVSLEKAQKEFTVHQ